MPQTEPFSSSSAKGRVPRPILYIVLLFDPRRWVGAVLAVGGVIVSIVTPFLPTSVSARILYSDKTIVPPRPRSLSTPIQQKRPVSPVLVLVDDHPRWGSSASSAVASSSHTSLPKSDSSHLSMQRAPSPLATEVIIMPLTSSPRMIQKSRPYLDSLDLASPNSPNSPLASSPASADSRRQFRVKIGFGKKRTSADVHEDEVHLESDSVELADSTNDSHRCVIKRCNTAPTTSGMSGRRKFSFFNRDRSHLECSLATTSDIEYPFLNLSSAHAPTRLSPIPQSLRGGPSTPIVTEHSPQTALNSSQEEIPLSRTTTPPVRMMRTDPYKKFGVPVPGSEQAKAFVKAEKQWVKAEKERREKERVVKEAEMELERVRLAKEKETTEQNDKGKQKEGCAKRNSVGAKWKRLSKGKEKEKEAPPRTPVTPPVLSIQTPSTAQGVLDPPDPGVEADEDGENDAHSQSHEGVMSDEFGVLLAIRDGPGATVQLNFLPPAKSKGNITRPKSSSASTGTKKWMFVRRAGTDGVPTSVGVGVGSVSEKEGEEMKERREKRGGMRLPFISAGRGNRGERVCE